MSMKSLFTTPATIKSWDWDGSFNCEEIIPVQTANSDFVKIELDSESILLRTLKLRKSKNTMMHNRPQVRPVKSEPESHTTFLPAPLHKMTQQELKQSLKSIGLQTTGTRADLVERLEKFMNSGKK